MLRREGWPVNRKLIERLYQSSSADYRSGGEAMARKVGIKTSIIAVATPLRVAIRRVTADLGLPRVRAF
jgi:hypothetical protein